jgi:hypothetical protein
LLGNGEKLNELLIEIEVYDRGGDFNPQQDPIVRVQAHQIRRGLRVYYEEEGKTNPWVIDLPAGHYMPRFSKVTRSVETSQPLKGQDVRTCCLKTGDGSTHSFLGYLGSVWVYPRRSSGIERG